MALLETASCRSLGNRAGREKAGHLAPRELGASLFSIDREGLILWSSTRAQQELGQLAALAERGADGSSRLTGEWARRFWAQVRDTDKRQLRLLLPGLLPQAGMLMWDPARGDRLSVIFWCDAGSDAAVDPLWHEILTRVGSTTELPAGAAA